MSRPRKGFEIGIEVSGGRGRGLCFVPDPPGSGRVGSDPEQKSWPRLTQSQSDEITTKNRGNPSHFYNFLGFALVLAIAQNETDTKSKRRNF